MLACIFSTYSRYTRIAARYCHIIVHTEPVTIRLRQGKIQHINSKLADSGITSRDAIRTCSCPIICRGVVGIEEICVINCSCRTTTLLIYSWIEKEFKIWRRMIKIFSYRHSKWLDDSLLNLCNFQSWCHLYQCTPLWPYRSHKDCFGQCTTVAQNDRSCKMETIRIL